MTNHTSPEVKLAMIGVDLCNALIAFLVNEGLIDKTRLSDWFNRVVDGRTPEEQNDPASVLLRQIAEQLAVEQKQTGQPSWLQGVIDGGRAPNDDC